MKRNDIVIRNWVLFFLRKLKKFLLLFNLLFVECDFLLMILGLIGLYLRYDVVFPHIPNSYGIIVCDHFISVC